ncbi:V-type ATP synthase subunit A [Candidatus Peregrinibacteria bacterium]|jgi:V/A-type H+/Na+-transporting ATPase subunit A|nr:V-type ATP synthase subunit A [Candidatus Peregrinibacteria bacterium]MBT4631679.1 V-type ATP synthase subunit A [Candidatus Peregrinibacteria bacterium]MBT5517029.1 V-type ATP synthase subunit A [Candidatus Peregrinibacteria bacterium]MBT5823911.1 V-type ATP synthase subunit A [Candidatus Peregrinibacteria bacterium]
MTDKPSRTGTIIKVAGPLVVATGMKNAKMFEVARIGDERLVGEIIRLNGDEAAIQVYEETAGIGPGEPVELTGDTMTVDLGPGLLTSIYDGIQRPLSAIEKEVGPFITRGVEVKALDRDKKWDLKAVAKAGDKVTGGDVLGTVQETTLIEHKVMVPPHISGKLKEITGGKFTIEDVFAKIEDEDGKTHDIIMLQKWPIRIPRPIQEKKVPNMPLKTGGRSIDTFFTLAKGGAAAIPGPFGAGKTVTQQSLAKFCDAQIIVYIGCGERGNEMTEVLVEFPHLEDPNTGEPLMKRTILIANTSNMPVAAREASVYTGITIAEYYRDMGYDIALMADSTSRWAEAMREMGGRLEEMPGEEGYPAYLASKIAAFYERAGYVDCLGSDNREGTLSVIGAVSPPGGDFSEPVTQNTLRVTKTFWGLDSKLAYARHYPAINWLTSYTLYADNIEGYLKKEVAEDFPLLRNEAMDLLQKEAKLEELVRLVGADSLSNAEQLLLLVAKSLREDFLFQNAFDPEDARTPIRKQYLMLKTILTIAHAAEDLLDKENFEIDDLKKLEVLQEVARVKEIPADDEAAFEKLMGRVQKDISALA